MKYIYILLIIFFMTSFVNAQSSLQDVKQKIVGKWYVVEYNLLDEENEDQAIASGASWKFYADGTCIEGVEPGWDNASFTYEISNINCETGQTSNQFYYIYIRDVNRNIHGNDYCFLISNLGPIDKTDTRDYLSLYRYGAERPNVLVRL